ncbi:MAG: ribosomal L7Ae/L30e/S12e/Gadd45 family protein [Nitrososphaerales archaeon]|nr:ribosomal L7Ae/L30e/S12e/Gadd45 family protein [Nitrososphaerales archaeon]
MISKKDLEKVLRTIVKTGKVVIGSKEALRSVKGSKIVIYSSSLSEEKISNVVKECKSLEVPLMKFEGTSVDLGRICGRLYPISAMAIKSPGEGDLSLLIV